MQHIVDEGQQACWHGQQFSACCTSLSPTVPKCLCENSSANVFSAFVLCLCQGSSLVCDQKHFIWTTVDVLSKQNCSWLDYKPHKAMYTTVKLLYKWNDFSMLLFFLGCVCTCPRQPWHCSLWPTHFRKTMTPPLVSVSQDLMHVCTSTVFKASSSLFW